VNENLVRDFQKMFIKYKNFEIQKKVPLKGLLKIRSNFNLSKIHNYHSRTKVKV
jgi:hypothetical protein